MTEVLRYATAPLSLSQPLGEDDDAELGDVVEDHAAISPFDAVAASLLSGEVDRVFVVLDGRRDPPATFRAGSERAPHA